MLSPFPFAILAPRRAQPLGAFVFGGALLFTASCGEEAEDPAELPPPPPPDILLVSIDSLRADHVGCYGSSAPTTPFLDRLAAEGVRCATTVSSTSWTAPAHAAMLTGLHDSAHGLVDDFMRLPASAETLAERLSEAGYRTYGFFGGPYLDPVFGFDQGFDEYVDCMAPMEHGLDPQDAEFQKSLKKVGRASQRDITGPRTLQAVRERLGSPSVRPRFFFVHLWDVHYDYFAPEETVRLFAPHYDGRFDGARFMKDPRIHPGMSAEDLRTIEALYDAEIRFTDGILEQLVAAITGSDPDRELLTVVTADHGEEFFEHGGKGHRHTLFDELLLVPLVFHWPGRIPAGSEVQRLTRTVDVHPTLLSLVGAANEAMVHGRDISPLFEDDEALPEIPALSELLCYGQDVRSVRSRDAKLVRFGATPNWAYFDLVDDPGEQRRQGAGPRSSALQGFLGDALESTEAMRLPRDPDAAVELDPETRRRLQELGYLPEEDGDEPPGGDDR